MLIATGTHCDVTEEYHRERYPASLYADFLYDFSKADTTFSMPSELSEISGLSNFHDTHLLAVQDEKGHVYQINQLTGMIDRKIKFGSDGDYEGIEYVEPIVSVVKSNGNVYQFEYPQKASKVEADTYKTSLKGSDEIEGLGYLTSEEVLVLTNKEGKEKGLYRFSAEDGLKKKTPMVTKSMVKEFVESSQIELLIPLDFKPSGLAVHPVTEEIYMLAHTGKCIVILDSQYQISGFVQLNPSMFPQPEGICFTSDGTLYISNEASFNSANILKFKMKRD